MGQKNVQNVKRFKYPLTEDIKLQTNIYFVIRNQLFLHQTSLEVVRLDKVCITVTPPCPFLHRHCLDTCIWSFLNLFNVDALIMEQQVFPPTQYGWETTLTLRVKVRGGVDEEPLVFSDPKILCIFRLSWLTCRQQRKGWTSHKDSLKKALTYIYCSSIHTMNLARVIFYSEELEWSTLGIIKSPLRL